MSASRSASTAAVLLRARWRRRICCLRGLRATALGSMMRGKKIDGARAMCRRERGCPRQSLLPKMACCARGHEMRSSMKIQRARTTRTAVDQLDEIDGLNSRDASASANSFNSPRRQCQGRDCRHGPRGRDANSDWLDEPRGIRSLALALARVAHTRLPRAARVLHAALASPRAVCRRARPLCLARAAY